MTIESQPFPLCKRGHLQTPENVIRRSDGGKQCGACKKGRVREWRKANPDKVAQHRANGKGAANTYMKAKYAAHPEHFRTARKKRRAALRSGALNAYGRACNCCGENAERLLTIDHVNNDGAAHRKSVGKDLAIFQWLLDNSYPSGFQTMCYSCNVGRHINGGDCPHAAPEREPVGYKQRYRQALKSATVEAYGGRCACCCETLLPLLTIDHPDNDGAEHRRSLGHTCGGEPMYRWLRDNEWPPGFRVLCWNCNTGRYFNGGACPHLSM